MSNISKPKTSSLPHFVLVRAVLCALFAALTAVLSQLAFNIGPVPVNLALVSVFLSVGLLGWKWGSLSQLLFLAMGALGLPVFANFKGGPDAFFGPTGGFLCGYLLCALAAGLLLDRFGRKIRVAVPAFLLGLLLCYLLGILWFMYTKQLPLGVSLGYCVFPFLPGDAGKIALCAFLTNRLFFLFDPQKMK
ncbi:MAG: biotin transporter BioY [Oscillospiraceae bacterium]|jgi:biotin transport system substrate-specific component|nr:biotin transporter BioY [Oscillospiraceae bacterium]